MKTEKIIGLRTCPLCGHQAVMRKNASKRFQIHCQKCKCCTAWTSKTDAIVRWYNNASIYEATHGITPPVQTETPDKILTTISEQLAEQVQQVKNGGIIPSETLQALAEKIIKLTRE